MGEISHLVILSNLSIASEGYMVRNGVERDSGWVEDAPTREREREQTPPTGDDPAETYMRIQEVSDRTGLSKRAIRYYEELGLLEHAHRSVGNYRLYSMNDVALLRRIKEMRELLGLDLDSILKMVESELERQEARSRFYNPEAAPATRLGALDDAERVTREQLRLIEERVEALNTMGQSLRERLAIYKERRAEIIAQSAQTERAAEQRGEG